jgi:hypothetical protein
MQITETAARELKKLKDIACHAQPDGVPRLTRGEHEDHLQLILDIPKPGDAELYYADEKVLILDADTSRALADVTLDCRETPAGPSLFFEREP